MNIKRGVFSELLSHPEESIEDQIVSNDGEIDDTSSKFTSIIPVPPLEGLLGATSLKAFPRVKGYIRPGWKRPAISSQDAQAAGYKRSAIDLEDLSFAISVSGNNNNINAKVAPNSVPTPLANEASVTVANLHDDESNKKPRINYQRALEPKVQLPFESRAGQTPRKIEIERRKRLFSNQRIDELIATALATNFGTAGDDIFARKLPLSAFDDSEFDQRTVAEWMDMSVSPSDVTTTTTALTVNQQVKKMSTDRTTTNFRFIEAKVPVPAKVNTLELNTRPAVDAAAAGTKISAVFSGEWHNCVVTAYDLEDCLWK
ncbi:hypothetical protein HK100_005262, partial [Physocladia obscura]